MSDLRIGIAAEFTGANAFKKADTATAKLTKSAKSLGKTLGLTLSAAAVLSYAKASVTAAANDQKAQKQLALALKNVGLERSAASAESYIQRLQSEFGIVDDKLRPAYQKLAIATHSSYETQKLLNLSLDISASTGKDLDSVTSALSKAYLGSNTALSKLGIGITKADLKSKSFDEITNQLADTFKGAATTSADTFAGSIDKLSVASNNAKEIIGTSLIGALKTLSGDTTLSTFSKNLESTAQNLADTISGIALIINAINHIPGAGIIKLLWAQPKGTSANPFSSITEWGAQQRRKAEVAAQKNPIQSGTYLNPAVVATTKNTVAVTKLTAAQIAQTKLDKAKAMFDLQRIGISAALKGNITGDARNRLMAMQAIENGDSAGAAKYSGKINPNAATSIVVNVTPQNLIGTQQDLIDQIKTSLQVANRRAYGSTYATI